MIPADGLGGFLGLPEVPSPRPTARAALSNGRSCLRRILLEVGPSEIWVPHWQCPDVDPVLAGSGRPVRRYPVGEDLRPLLPAAPPPGALVLAIDYFGLLGSAMHELCASLAATVVVDGAQAFFDEPPANAWGFDSPRKFFGVPDGGFLFGPRPVAPVEPPAEAPTRHLALRAAGSPDALHAYREAEEARRASDEGMSLATRLLLASTDRSAVARARRANWAVLDARLAAHNGLRLDLDSTSVPLCYPFLPKSPLPHAALHTARVWVPRYWPGLPDLPPWERHLVDHLLPLPLDQRYGEAEMEALAAVVLDRLGAR